MRRLAVYIPWVLAALFAFAILPTIGTLSVFHPDERYYSEAALHMNQSRDYITPLDHAGNLRLVKPFFTYWAVAFSYLLLGVNSFSMRFPSVLAAAISVFFSYRLGFELSGKMRVGLLSALITMSSVQFILAAGRANPDIFLCLFMLLSFYGFSGLVLLPQCKQSYYWYAYLGAGMAIGTKGLLGLVFIAYVWLYVLFDRKLSFKRIIYVPALLTGGAVAGWWYLSVQLLYGGHSLGGFWQDQLGRNMAGSFLAAILGIVSFVYLEIIYIYPWSFIALETVVKTRRDGVQKEQGILSEYMRFSVPWLLLGAIIFGVNKHLRIRYMLPYIPIIATWLAMGIAQARQRVKLRAIWHQAMVVAMVLMFVSLVMIVAQAELGAYIPAFVTALICVVGYAVLVASKNAESCLRSVTVLGVSLVALFPLSYLTFVPILGRDPAPRVVRYLEEHGYTEKIVYCVTKSKFFEKMRMSAPSGIKFVLHKKRTPLDVPTGSYVLVFDDMLPDYRQKILGYHWINVAGRMGKVKVSGILKGLLLGRLKAVLDAHKEQLYLGIPQGAGKSVHRKEMGSR